MSIDWQRVLPVVVSICIIIAVAVLRQHSRTLAAIAATMPINVPLALWIVYSGGGANDRDALMVFFETMMIGLPPTFLFVVVAYLAARAGWNVAPMIVVGYLAWGGSLLLLLPLRALFRH